MSLSAVLRRLNVIRTRKVNRLYREYTGDWLTWSGNGAPGQFVTFGQWLSALGYEKETAHVA